MKEGAADSGVECFGSPALDVPECAHLELCVRSMPTIDVNDDNCAPGQCAWAFESDVGDTLTFENDAGWVFLRFSGGGLSSLQSTADLAAVFQHVNFYAKFPKPHAIGVDAAAPPAPGSDAEPIYFEQREGVAAFDTFTVDDGHLHVKLSFTVARPYVSVLSTTAFCGDTNLCSCNFDGVAGPTTFDVDLPFSPM